MTDHIEKMASSSSSSASPALTTFLLVHFQAIFEVLIERIIIYNYGVCLRALEKGKLFIYPYLRHNLINS